MNTAVENWINCGDITEESTHDCRVCDQIVEAHSTHGSKIFSTVNSSMAHLKSQTNGFVSGIFKRFQTADSEDTLRLDKVKSEVNERLKREIEKVNMISATYQCGDSEWFYL